MLHYITDLAEIQKSVCVCVDEYDFKKAHFLNIKKAEEIKYCLFPSKTDTEVQQI